MSTSPEALSLRELVEVLIHDVKNPLASLVTNAQFIRESATDGDIGDAAADIEAAAQWIDRLLSNIGDLSRLREGEGLRSQDPGDLAEATKLAVRTMQTHARDRNLTLSFNESTPPRPIKAGTDLVRRMAETMIEAGVRNANGSSEIDIAVRKRELVVSFNGSPLSETERVDVFEERAFIGDSSKRLRLAPAFGLPFVKRAARALGGDLVADEAAQGVTLRLTLP